MNYWICATNEDNWNVVKKQKVWGVPETRRRSQIEKVKPGDYLVFYVMPKRIGGIFVAASQPFESKKKIFSWTGFGREELFPHRVKLEPFIIAKELMRVDELIGRLSARPRRAIVKISEEDFELIRRFLS